MELPESLRRLASDLPVPVRRMGYRGAYIGLRIYWLVRRPDTSGVKCVLTDGEKILLVRHSYGSRGWDLPGGSRRKGEAPVEAARREMSEELGVKIPELSELGQIVVDSHHRLDHVHFFRAELHAPELTIDLGELLTAQWFPRRELPPRLGRYARVIIARLPPSQSDQGSHE